MSTKRTQTGPISKNQSSNSKTATPINHRKNTFAEAPHFVERTIVLETLNQPDLTKVLSRVNASEEIKTLWHIINVNAIQRLGMTDHGSVHFQIVSRIGLTMLRLLQKAGVRSSVVSDFNLTQEHAEIIVMLACLLHDIGMTVHRKGHEEFSVVLASRIVRELLAGMWDETTRTIVTSEVLHAIISHRRDGSPLTLEAGVVRVADALDMTKGRSRIPYEAGKIDIHSVSAMAIDEIELHKGTTTPIRVNIVMNHTAGIFQVDELLKEKIRGSGLENYLDVKVYIEKGQGRKLFKDFL